MVGRRRFLLLGLGGSAAALVGGTTLGAAAESPTVIPVWRLSADWGYAVPPKGRTQCRCQSCRGHAANKVFASKAVALANRIHPCCVCQPYSIDLLASDAASLFVGSPSGDSIDLRNDDNRARFAAAMVRSLAPVPTPAPTIPATPTPPTASTPTPDISSGGPDLSVTSEVVAPTVSARVPTLPVTGSDPRWQLTAASVLVVAGVAAISSACPDRSA